MADLRIAVLGAGAMGRTHAPAWQTVPNAKVVAIADLDEERLKKAQADFDIPEGCTEWADAVALEEVNVVSVCLPSYLHWDATVFSAEQGRHILCEKPIAMTLRQADDMIATAQHNHVLLGVGFCKRQGGAIQKMAELVQAGEIRRPVTYRFVTGWEIRPKPWIMDRTMGGGPVVDICCHFFDQWRVIFGSEPVRVTAQGQTFSTGAPELPGVTPEVDTATVLVEFGSGDLGMISISWGLPRGVAGQNCEEILGPGGSIRPEGYHKVTMIRQGGEETVFEDLPSDVYVREIHNFAAAARGEETLAATGEDGRIALQVSLAALLSIDTKETVELS